LWWYNGRDLGIEQEIYGMKIYKVSNNGNLFDIRDYGAYVKLFNKSCNLLGMRVVELGKGCGLPIYLGYREPNPELKNLLIVGGIHGEEGLCSWSILNFLVRESKVGNGGIFSKVNISILPIFNPSGFREGERHNIKGERTNVFRDGEESEEGLIIKKHSNLLGELGDDCILSMHENSGLGDGFYIYANVDSNEIYDDDSKSAKDGDKIDGYTADLIDITVQNGIRRFKIRQDGSYIDPQGLEEDKYEIIGGIVNNLRDNSFEDCMNREKGVKVVLITETPSKGVKVDKRMSTHMDIIDGIINYMAIDTKKEKRVIGIPKCRQVTNTSCGGACLNTILEFNGIEKNELDIDELCGMSEEGIEPENLVKVAKEFGLSSKLIKGSNIEELKGYVDNGIPVIVAIVAWGKFGEKNYSLDEDGHYVIVIGYDECRVYIEDPSIKNGRGFLDWNEFGQRWHDIDGKRFAMPMKGKAKKVVVDDFKYFRIL